MRARHAVSLFAVLALVGCDRITGAADQKILDAQAIGYACRISLKTPEDCMKENETHSPTYVLNGWKEADRDINERVIDPSMGKRAAATAAPATPAAARNTPAAVKSAGKTEAEMHPGKVQDTKVETSGKKQAKPGKDELVKKPAP
ncbi:MAG: hypothetical protein A2143_06350 [Gallionellales bacterium RBG_16_57_15]|nr:MAG: hypothetical protein A2143_06350 [Gallionellales bacterium RBG_16_57_15]